MKNPLELNLSARIFGWLKEQPQTRTLRDLPDYSVAMSSFGGWRRENNQDLVATIKISFAAARRSSLLVHAVLDGMGGMKDGAECARWALSSFISSLVLSAEESTEGQVKRAVLAANNYVFDKYRGNGGTTLAAVIYTVSETIILNAGDTRIYQFDSSKKLSQLSIDDTLASALETMHFKKARKEDVNDSASNQLLQFIGIGPELDPHLISHAPTDRIGYVIATDGVYKPANGTFEKLVLHANSPKELSQRLITLSDWLGGDDNASVISLWPANRSLLFGNESGLSSITIYLSSGESFELHGQIANRQAGEEVVSPQLFDLPTDKNPQKKLGKAKTKTNRSSNKKKSRGRKGDQSDALPLEIKLID